MERLAAMTSTVCTGICRDLKLNVFSCFFYLSFGETKLGFYSTIPRGHDLWWCEACGFPHISSLPPTRLCLRIPCVLLQGSHYEYDAKVIKQVEGRGATHIPRPSRVYLRDLDRH